MSVFNAVIITHAQIHVRIPKLESAILHVEYSQS